MGEVSAEEIMSAGEVHDGPSGDYIEGEVVEERPAQPTKAQRPAGGQAGQAGQDPGKLKSAIFNHPEFKRHKGQAGWSIREISVLSPAAMAAKLAGLEGKPQPKPVPEQPEPTEAATPEVETPEVDWSLERQITFARDTIESMAGWGDKYKAIYGAVVEAAVMGNDLASLNDVLDHMRAEAAKPAEVVEQ
jgi:hypothetical protein